MAELNEQKLNQLNARAQEIVTDFAEICVWLFSLTVAVLASPL